MYAHSRDNHAHILALECVRADWRGMSLSMYLSGQSWSCSSTEFARNLHSASIRKSESVLPAAF